MRSISRIIGCSINTVTKLLVEAGEACLDYHDETVRGLSSIRIECKEIWSFRYTNEENAHKTEKPLWSGDVWTWTSIDADSKLICNWFVGGRDAEFAHEFMSDLAGRLDNRVQLTTDGHKAYLTAVDSTLCNNIDYAQLVNLYGNQPQGKTISDGPNECTGIKKKVRNCNPSETKVSTSDAERQNLTMRSSISRFKPLINSFTKKFENHCHALAIHFVHYNFCRKHKTLGMTPAQATGLTQDKYDIAWIIGLIDAHKRAKNKRGSQKKTNSN